MKDKTVTHVLSFKAVISVKDNTDAEEFVRQLIDMGFKFEEDKAYVSRQVGHYPSTIDIIDTKALANEEILFSFNFVGGGFNSVTAKTLDEAKLKATHEFGNNGHVPDTRTFKAHRTKASRDAYWKSLPLMD